MSFPNINYKILHTKSDQSLQILLENKLLTLEKYIGDETDVKCDAEFAQVTPHRHGLICRVEVNLWLAGNLYRSESTQERFEVAIDEVRNELDKELRRASDKRISLIQRGGRKIKSMLRGW